uniref:type IX secretion system protein PorD n=1 Tax=Roseivirga sp. TaxID=1964215 RepID=UPI004048CD44
MPLLKNYSIKLCLLLAFSSGALQAQELDFSVSINATNVQTTERAIFAEMETSFQRFFNDRTWTNDNFQTNEKIKGNLILTIQSQPTIGQFVANAQIQVIRPVYGTSHETLLLNFADRDWDFQFTQGQPMDFNDNRYLSNITSLLAYYAYVAIGLDYDSFGPLGGTEHYRKALNVVNNAQTSGGNGWGQFQNRRNRYWLIENLSINNQYEPVRQALYDYHINGLDKFKDDPDASREVFKNVISKIQEVNRVLPNAILIIAFMDAKNEELSNIFSKGQINIRRDVYNELLKLDPTRRSKYQKMVQN